jgi:predicted nucleic acid-binding protein
MKILLDTNVVLDLLLAREAFVEEAKEIFILLENHSLQGYICTTTVTTLHYLIEREKSKQEANEIIENLLKLFSVTEVNKEVLLLACHQNGADYEDAVIYSSCEKEQIDHIITRDKRGFKNAQTSILAPREFLALYALS